MRNKILVSPSEYDDIGEILMEFGSGFEFDSCDWEDLCRHRKLAAYESVYLNCASPFLDDGYRVKLASALKNYIHDGGTVYASDWAAVAISEAFPEKIALDLIGEDGDYDCLVADRGLQEFLGREMSVHFDTPAWSAFLEISSDVRVFVEARDLHRARPDRLRLPVVVGFQHGAGHVLVTSFHNEQQLSARERRLLRFLAMQPTLARAAHASSQLLSSQNAKVAAEFMDVVQIGKPSPVIRFETTGSTALVCLNWQGEAELKLQVRGPDGALKVDRTSTKAPLTGEIVGLRSAGVLECRVEAISLPQKSLPFVLTVASAQAIAAPPAPPSKRSSAAPNQSKHNQSPELDVPIRAQPATPKPPPIAAPKKPSQSTSAFPPQPPQPPQPPPPPPPPPPFKKQP